MPVDLPPSLRRLRNVQRRSERALRSAHTLIRPTDFPKVAYVGWAGTGNVGDDAIREAHRRSMPAVSLVSAPVHDIEAVERLVALSRRPAQLTGLVLGGGTLIGRAAWRQRLEAAGRMAGGPWVMLGVGVEDPSFVARSAQTYTEDLSAWRTLLDRFERVSVRGPLSAELLANAGIDAVIDGDPALLLEPVAVPDGQRQTGTAVISVAATEDVYAGSPDVVELVAPTATWLVRQGFAVKALPMHAADVAPCRHLEALVPGVLAIGACPSVDETLAVVAAANLVVGQRLHAVVLAAAAGVPFLALDYRPKCRDFLLSLGLPDWGVTLRSAGADDVLTGTEAIVGESATRRATVTSAVAILRTRLRSAAALNQSTLLADERQAS